MIALACARGAGATRQHKSSSYWPRLRFTLLFLAANSYTRRGKERLPGAHSTTHAPTVRIIVAPPRVGNVRSGPGWGGGGRRK